MQTRKRSRVSVSFAADHGRTKQSFKDDCDINRIISKYQKSGLLTHVARHQGRYADVSEVTDYATAFSLVRAAEVSFNELPASLREAFGNSPANFFDFVSNPENIAQVEQLGLVPRDFSPGSSTPAEQKPPEGASEGSQEPSQG